MLMSHIDPLSELKSSKDLRPALPLSEPSGGNEGNEECPEQVLYATSFEELASKIVQYDSVIFILISLILVLAWGFGILLLVFMPFRRNNLWKYLSCQKVYVTPTEIVYKDFVTFEKRIPLSLVLEVVIEQGCLQSMYGIHTLRVISIGQGTTTRVDEVQFLGISDPYTLRKVIIEAASKITPDVSKCSKLQIAGSPYYNFSPERELLLSKLEEVNKSVKKFEQFFQKSHGAAAKSS